MPLTFSIDPAFHMWFAIALTAMAVISFIREKISLEATAVTVVAVLLLFGQIFPLPSEANENLMSAQRLLAGFANPSLLAVLALLVMGKGLLQTEALRPVTRLFITKNKALWPTTSRLHSLRLAQEARFDRLLENKHPKKQTKPQHFYV